jgi:hypothetical protein
MADFDGDGPLPREAVATRTARRLNDLRAEVLDVLFVAFLGW